MVTCHSALTMVSQHMIACVHHASCCELLSLAGQTAEKDTHSAQSVLHPFANCHPVCISPLPPSSQVWRILAMFGHVLGQYPPFSGRCFAFCPLEGPRNCCLWGIHWAQQYSAFAGTRAACMSYLAALDSSVARLQGCRCLCVQPMTWP